MPDVPSLVSSPQAPPPPPRDDIGYVLGWFCAGILALGVVMAVVYLVQRSYRKAFQAVALPVAVLSWITLMMEGLVEPSAYTDARGIVHHGIGRDIGVIGVLVGVSLLPILLVYLVRKLPWPPARKAAA
jgi:hypothetical protein